MGPLLPSVSLPAIAQHVEWKAFVTDRITQRALTEADRLNGTSQRYHVSFSCEAHRVWDTKTNTWSDWRPRGHLLFPVERRASISAALD